MDVGEAKTINIDLIFNEPGLTTFEGLQPMYESEK